MDEEKQIEEIARVIYENTAISCVETADEIAVELYEKGYRKASEVVEEIIRILRAAGINEHRYPVIAELKKKYAESEGGA